MLTLFSQANIPTPSLTLSFTSFWARFFLPNSKVNSYFCLSSPQKTPQSLSLFPVSMDLPSYLNHVLRISSSPSIFLYPRGPYLHSSQPLSLLACWTEAYLSLPLTHPQSRLYSNPSVIPSEHSPLFPLQANLPPQISPLNSVLP